MAFSEDSFVVGEKTEAIKALYQFDPKLAIVAAERQLHITTTELRPLASLLAQMAPDDAAERLVRVARIRENSRKTVAQALRHVNADQVDRVLQTCMSNPLQEMRVVGAELAGWQSPDRLIGPLRSMLEKEVEPKVIKAVLKALEHKRQQQTALKLLQAFEGASDRQRWGYLLAPLDIADPHLLNDSKDPLWIGAVLNNALYIFWYVSKNDLKKMILKGK